MIKRKLWKKGTMILLATALLSSSVFANTGVESTSKDSQSIALNRETGKLDVDYKNYMSQHDVVYNTPIINPGNALPMGNGRMGGMIWNENGLMMQVTNVDASPYTGISQGLINFYTDPMVGEEDPNFQQRLNLYDGIVTTEYDSEVKVTFMGDPDKELFGIHIEDNRENVTTSYLDLSLWTNKLNADPNAPFGGRPGGNPSIPYPNQETWLNPHATVGEDYVAITRGEEDPNNFGYTLAATVEGANFTTKEVVEAGEMTLRLEIEPTSEYTIWIASPARRHAENYETLPAAEKLLDEAKSEGYESVYNRFIGYWNDFWTKSFLYYKSDNSDMDYLENSWYLYQYLFGCGSKGEFPFHFINGVWKWERQDESMWSWDYTHFNQRTFQYTFYATNRLEFLSPYLEMLHNNFEGYKKYTQGRFGKNGIMAPERHTWDTERMVGYEGTYGCPYTTNVFSTGPEQSLMMFEKYKFTGDETYLREKAYPFMKEICIFISEFLNYDEEKGEYYIESSHALETYWNCKNSIVDIAAFNRVLECTIESSQILGVDEELAVAWQMILDKLVKMPKGEAKNGGEKYLAHEAPLTQLMNSQNPELELIWPFNRTGIDAEDYDIALNTYNERIMPLNIWTPEPIFAARLGLGDDSFKHARDMVLRSQTHTNGIHDDRNGLFESNALIVTGINEEMLQSYDDLIRVFPAVVSDPSFEGKFSLLARNGFLVSSEYSEGMVKYISLVSQLGNEAKVINPWKDQSVNVINLETNEVVLTTAEYHIVFNTEVDGKYVIEKSDRPLSEFSQETLTGVRNEAPKKMSNGNVTRRLGLGTSGAVEGPLKIDDKHESLNYIGNWANYNAPTYYMGTETYSSQKDSYVELKFKGTGVEFIAPKVQHLGKVDVYVDGVLVEAAVDLYGPGNTPQQVIFSKTDLPYGQHTLKIVVTGEKNPDSMGSTVSIDAFEILNGDIEAELNSLQVSTAKGIDEITQKGELVQFVVETNPAGASKAVTWQVTDQDEEPTDCATIDEQGRLMPIRDGYIKVTAISKVNPEIKGSMEIKLTNIGECKEKIDDRSERIQYTSGWANWNDNRHYMKTEKYTAEAGEKATFTFTGTGVRVIGVATTQGGIMDVYVDGELAAEGIDTYRKTPFGKLQQVLFEIEGLELGEHTIEIVTTGKKHPDASRSVISLDAFEVLEENKQTGIENVINTKDSVKSGEEFKVILGVKGMKEALYAADLKIKYNDMFTLEGVKGVDPIILAGEQDLELGMHRILVGIQEGLIDASDLVELTFVAPNTEEDKEGTISIETSEFGIVVDGLDKVEEGSYLVKKILVEGVPEVNWELEDVNQDGKVDIGDLALAAYYYRVTEADGDRWEVAKRADMDGDGEITLMDLSKIANRIMEMPIR